MSKTTVTRVCVCAVLILTAIAPASPLHAQGIALTGVGPVNRAMGGAGTAAPLDAIGALHWNPGSIGALSNEIGFGTELLKADVRLSSTIGGSSGSTNGDAGWVAIPSIGWVHHLDGTPITMGLGVYGVAGFKNNLPRDPSNPLLSGAPLLGPAYASAEVLQIAPTLSYQLTDNFSVGLAPTITTVTVNFDPVGPSVITPAPTPGQGNRMGWGGGFQAGAYYRGDNGINAGATFKSKQWIENMNFFTPSGTVNWNLDYPMIISLGLSYTGMENWVFAIDGRYFDYAHTPGFQDFGWRSVFAGAVGAQYRMTDRLTARLGYNFNQNPIQSGSVARNLLDPLIQDQNVATGCSYRFTDHVDFNLAYVYLIKNSVSGPLPPGVFGPGAKASNQLQAHSAIMGISVRY
jgi:long-chain fatty acid transport protein